MPQLDINTFIFQYVSLVSLLTIVYFLMSYVVLPQILRALILRNKISSQTSMTADIAPSNILTLNKTLNSSIALNVAAKLNRNSSKAAASNITNLHTVALNSNYVDYLSLILIEDEKEYENNND